LPDLTGPSCDGGDFRFANRAPLPLTCGHVRRICSLRPFRRGGALDGRQPDQLRPIRFQNHIAPYATGSTLIEWGNTRVICGVTIEETVPRWMKEQSVAGGWITAEYSMLPYSTFAAETPRHLEREDRRSVSRNPAVDRPLDAGGGRSREAGLADPLGGL